LSTEATTRYLRGLGALLVTTSIIVNGAGSLAAVAASSSDLDNQSLKALIESWGTLKAVNQVSLLMAPIAALIIPLGTIVAGEGMAQLLMTRRERGTLIEERWGEVAALVEFEALRDAAINLGHSPQRANAWAAKVVRMPLSSQSVSDSATDRLTDKRAVSVDRPEMSVPTRNAQARRLVRDHLDRHPEDADLTARALARRVSEMSGPVGKSTAGQVQSEYRASSNGHDQN
jgi:hypothetical protein